MDQLHPNAVPLMSFRTGKQKGWVLLREELNLGIQAIEEYDGSIFMVIEFAKNSVETAMFNNWAEASDYLGELMEELAKKPNPYI